MSWSRQVRIFYTVLAAMFLYMLWGVASNVILGNPTDYRLYPILVALAFLLQFVNSRMANVKRENRQLVAMGIPGVLGALYVFYQYSGLYIIYNLFFMALAIFFFFVMEEEEVSYDLYRDRIIQSILALAVGGIMLLFASENTLNQVLRFYIFYLILAVITLREVRNYSNRIRNRKSFYTNIGLAVLIVLSSTSIVYKFFSKIFGFIFNLLNQAMSSLVLLLVKPIGKILEFFRVLIAAIIGDGKLDISEVFDKSRQMELPPPELIDNRRDLAILSFMVSVFVTVLLIAILYMIFAKYRSRKIYSDVFTTERERLENSKVSRKNTLRKFLKSIFQGKGGKRSQILEVYRRFLVKMDERRIYKPHMNASQLSHVARAYVDEKEALEDIANIYNEAKFSLHKEEELKLEDIKKDYDRVNKKLSKIKK